MTHLPFFSPKDKNPNPPMYIMPTGLPCVGKSTWRTQMLEKCKAENIPLTVVNADEIAMQCRDEYNAANPDAKHLTYSDFCNPPFNTVTEEKFRQMILDSNKQNGGIVILDRTYLVENRRFKALCLIESGPVHSVVFTVHDVPAWKANLRKRNETGGEKQITEEIANSLNLGATIPSLNEKFSSITHCNAIGELKWENGFELSQNKLIEIYRNYSAKNPIEEAESNFTYSC